MSNKDFWNAKLAANKSRDEETLQRLHDLGWQTFTVWECSIKNGDLGARLAEFLDHSE